MKHIAHIINGIQSLPRNILRGDFMSFKSVVENYIEFSKDEIG